MPFAKVKLPKAAVQVILITVFSLPIPQVYPISFLSVDCASASHCEAAPIQNGGVSILNRQEGKVTTFSLTVRLEKLAF